VPDHGHGVDPEEECAAYLCGVEPLEGTAEGGPEQQAARPRDEA
jgi:hypothetical protein